MYQHQVRVTAAFIIIFGHVACFLYAFYAIGQFTRFSSSETTQIILMTSPVMAAAAIGAVKYILSRETRRNRGKKSNGSYVVLVTVLPVVLIGLIFYLLHEFSKMGNRIGPDELKIGLGIVETMFGGFIGLISSSLFGEAD